MTEPIGKGCECLYAFDKGFIEQALRQMQEKFEQSAKNAAEALERDPETPMAQSTVNMSKLILGSISTILERVTAMPECK